MTPRQIAADALGCAALMALVWALFTVPALISEAPL